MCVCVYVCIVGRVGATREENNGATQGARWCGIQSSFFFFKRIIFLYVIVIWFSGFIEMSTEGRQKNEK